MALTSLRWIAGLIVGCLMMAVIIVSVPESARTPSDRGESLARRSHAANARVEQRAKKLSSALLIDSTRRIAMRSGAAPVRVFRDKALPPVLLPAFDEVETRLRSEIGLHPAVGVDVFLGFDTAKMIRGASNSRNGLTIDY